VIVRILGEAQYEVADEDRPTLDQLDAALVKAVDAGDEASFEVALQALTAEVRNVGHPVGADTFVPSDLVIPFADATLAETEALLADSSAADDG
jgi:hypothetical protein